MASRIRQAVSQHLAGQQQPNYQTINLNPGVIPASLLMRLAPANALIWAAVLWVASVFGSVVAFNGGFEHTLVITKSAAVWIGYVAEWKGITGPAVLFGIGGQLVATYLEFMNRHQRRHSSYFLPFAFDAGSNLVSYGPVIVSLIASLAIFLASLILPTITDSGIAWFVVRLLGFLAACYLITKMTAAPELTFVNDEI